MRRFAAVVTQDPVTDIFTAPNTFDLNVDLPLTGPVEDLSLRTFSSQQLKSGNLTLQLASEYFPPKVPKAHSTLVTIAKVRSILQIYISTGHCILTSPNSVVRGSSETPNRSLGLPILGQAEEARLDDPCASSIVEAPLDPTEFSFAQIEQLGFFSPPAHGPLAQGQGAITGAAEGFQPVSSFPNHWEHSLTQATEGFHSTDQATLPPTTVADRNQFPAVLSISGLRNGHQSHNVIDKRRRSRLHNKSRQIALSHIINALATKEALANIHWMAQLTEINSRLLDLASVLPQPGTAQCNIQLFGGPGDETFPNQGFPVEEIFQLTRRVADLLDGLRGEKGSTATRMDSSDPGNSMLVLSTYVRLLDMYQKIFSLVSMELAQADAEATFRFWRLPDVQVGSFAVIPIPPLQMSLTIQLAEEFLARLRAATAALDLATSNGPDHKSGGSGGAGGEMDDCSNGKSMFSDVVDISYRAVKKKEESLAKHLAELRDEIQAILDE
ncbi:hypothetical protein E4U55_005634 [Claviceps digitariae]|nr:hypothetical protein E4U55_005634 [Claviceps digitariae]